MAAAVHDAHEEGSCTITQSFSADAHIAMLPVAFPIREIGQSAACGTA
jgi:hypothetical protein